MICDLWLTLDYTMCTSSCLSILVICVDRYWSLAYPITYRRFMSTVVVFSLIIPTWLIPILLYGIGIFAIHQFGARDIEPEKCYVHYYDDPFFTIVSTVINYWAIIVAILILYYKIYKITKFFWRKKRTRSVPGATSVSPPLKSLVNVTTKKGKQSKNNADTSSDSDDENDSEDEKKAEAETMIPKGSAAAEISSAKSDDLLKKPNGGLLLEISALNGHKNNDGDTSTSPATTTSTAMTSCSTFVTVEEPSLKVSCSQQPPKPQVNQQKGNSKAMRVLTAVLSSFIICWTPYAVFVIVLSFDGTLIPNGVFYTSYGLCYINSLFNPGLYAYANEIFRRTFWKILRCR